MRYLADTHILLWWLSDNKELTEEERYILQNEAVWISTGAIWEIVIKVRIGKLNIPGNIEEVLNKQSFEILDISLDHVLALETLEEHHSDPFDRIQVAQCITEGLTFMTRDKRIRQYTDLNVI